jgi:ABC-type lipoprotein release transport system permease subunit
MLTVKLAWRSFLRHRRRTIITVCAVSLSLAMMLFFVGLADDGHARMAELGIRMGQGNVLVQGKGYQREETLDHLVADPATVLSKARALKQVQQAVPRVRTTGLLSTGDRSAPVLVSGVDPRLEPRASSIPAHRRIVDGGYLRPMDQLPSVNQPADIYIGQELAKTLELQVGDRAVLMVSPKDAARPASSAFIVRGIFKTGVAEMDRMWVEVPISEAQRLLKLGHKVTQVALLLDRLEDTAGVTATLRAELPHGDLEVLAWQEALKELHDAIVVDDAGMYVMMIIVFVLMVFVIFTMVFMSVVERTREFGVMMALGCSGRRLSAVVFTEGLILALVSAAVGLAVGLALHSYVAATGIDITKFAGDYEIAGIILEGHIYSRLSVGVVVQWTLVVMGLVLVSTLYPAVRAARLVPLEAIRHV